MFFFFFLGVENYTLKNIYIFWDDRIKNIYLKALFFFGVTILRFNGIWKNKNTFFDYVFYFIQWRLQKKFWGWSLRNLNYANYNKKRILYINKHTHTHKYIKSYNFLLQIFLFWNRYMIVSLSMLQVTSLQKFS